jgi:serine/threonine-protein kinase
MPGDKVTIDSPKRRRGPSFAPGRHLLRRFAAAVAVAGSGPDRPPADLLASTDDYVPLTAPTGAVAAADHTLPRGPRRAALGAREREREREPERGRERRQPLAEERDLLAARLDAAVQFLVLILGFWMTRSLFLPAPDTIVLLAQGWLVVALGIVHLWLANDRSLTVRQLRALELAVFGALAGLLAASQYRLMHLRYVQDDATLVLVAMKSGVLSTLVLLTTYGVFIPNGWRRAALVVTPMALAPAAVAWMVLAVHPELARVAARVAGLEPSGDNALMLLTGAALAIFGTQIVGAVAARVSEAHHLGPYHLREPIGSGGMGEVYLAEHQFLKRPCAIKLIRTGKAADPRALARFEREVRTTAQLSHWNTVEVYDYGRTPDGTFFYVMEYLPGLSLEELVRRHGPLPAERVIHLLRQACDALREAHGLGLIHRDIKPANIFAADRGGLHDVTKLLDFGLATRRVDAPASTLSHHGRITGSPLYMSPEQASGQRADHRSDIYALGAVAYYLLTGHAPFQRDTALSVMIAHARDAATPPSALRPDIPADLERIVLKCLAKDRAERYQDAASLDQALGHCAAAGLWTRERAAEWWRTAAVEV